MRLNGKNQTAACNSRFSFGEFADVEYADHKPKLLKPFARTREAIRIDELSSYPEDVCGRLLTLIDVDQLKSGEGLTVDPGGVNQQPVVSQRRYGRFQVQAAGHGHREDLVAMRPQELPQLIHSRIVRAMRPSDEDRAAGHEHVSTVYGRRGVDLAHWSIAPQQLGHQRRLGPARFGARPGDDRDFVTHDRDVFDKDGIRKIGSLVEPDDLTAGRLERPLVCGMLRPRALDINRLAIQVSQLAAINRRTDSTSYGDHRTITYVAAEAQRTRRTAQRALLYKTYVSSVNASVFSVPPWLRDLITVLV
jgi:hypothetical protein